MIVYRKKMHSYFTNILYKMYYVLDTRCIDVTYEANIYKNS